jgi:AcrR family transcriptional regulator
MMARPLRRPRPIREAASRAKSTSEQLIEAAATEFNESGFAGTDTNRIARRAGFAPQTFYRWFQDKVDIFIHVYDRWRQDLFGVLDPLFAKNATDVRITAAVIAHHKAYLIFRRSLRQLSVENDAIRAARAKSRQQQIGAIKALRPAAGRDVAVLTIILLQVERLADALAERELRDMGLDEAAAHDAMTRLIHDLRTG